jgi:hypothetical protein
MTTGTQYVQYRQLRAPREDKSVLIEPPADRVGELLAANAAQRAGYAYDVQGRPLGELAHQARQELLALACRWTSSYRDANPSRLETATTILLAGHQPQLFHPGVWFKNFVLDQLARQHGAVAVNLIVDNDTVKHNTLLVPGGSAAAPTLASLPFDRSAPPVPFEEWRIEDRPLFRRFGDRVVEQISPLVPDPLMRRYWPLAARRLCRTDNLGACLAQSRHQLEGQWGLDTWEVPVSWLCQTETFAWLVAHLLAQLPRFREAYNEVVHAYRRVNHIRSTAHPVPDLAQEGDWIEAPFWIWSDNDPQRRRLFVRQQAQTVALSDRRGLEVELPLRPEGDACRAVPRLVELTERGIKLRSRALITTLWSRLVLGDLFLHGIGGAKYDQVTDALIARFFGLQPPGYMVVSATVYLPIPHRKTTADDLRAVNRKLRELTFHPELYVNRNDAQALDGAAGPQALIAEKFRWIRTAPTPANARQRCLEIRRLNEALQPFVAADRARMVEERDRINQGLRAEGVLSARDYAFCLYPGDFLRECFAELAPRVG